MTMVEEFTYRDIPGLMSYWRNWHDYHSRSSPASMAFTQTGAVPLEISPDPAGPRAGAGGAINSNTNCVRCVSDVCAILPGCA